MHILQAVKCKFDYIDKSCLRCDKIDQSIIIWAMAECFAIGICLILNKPTETWYLYILWMDICVNLLVLFIKIFIRKAFNWSLNASPGNFICSEKVYLIKRNILKVWKQSVCWFNVFEIIKNIGLISRRRNLSRNKNCIKYSRLIRITE